MTTRTGSRHTPTVDLNSHALPHFWTPSSPALCVCAEGLQGARCDVGKEEETVLPWKPVSLSFSMISDPSWIWEHEGFIIAQTRSAKENQSLKFTAWIYGWDWCNVSARSLVLCLSFMTDCYINSFNCLLRAFLCLCPIYRLIVCRIYTTEDFQHVTWRLTDHGSCLLSLSRQKCFYLDAEFHRNVTFGCMLRFTEPCHSISMSNAERSPSFGFLHTSVELWWERWPAFGPESNVSSRPTVFASSQ